MFLYEIIIITIYAVVSTLSAGIKIEGLIDLGPKWSYEYKVLPIAEPELTSNTKNNTNQSHILNIRKDNENDIDKSTEETNPDFQSEHRIINNNQIIVSKEDFESSNSTEITTNDVKGSTQIESDDEESYTKQIRKKAKRVNHKDQKTNQKTKKATNNNKKKVKDDIKIHSFNDHISKQSLKIFNNWKKNTNSIQIRSKIDMLQDSFIDKFTSILKQNENYILRTKLAKQKVVVNLMDTANKMLQRCINYLTKDEDVARKLNILSLHKELFRQNRIENIHACKMLGACRTNDGYTEFIINILTTILQTSDSKIQQSSNALTEVVKSNDFSNILDSEAERQITNSINSIERLSPFSTRAMLLIFRNVLLNRNKPIHIMNSLDKNVAQRTEALHNLMDVLNKHMNTHENKKEWREIEKQVTDWKNNIDSKNIQNAMEKIIKQLKRVLEGLSRDVKRKISDYIKVLRSKLKI